MKFSKVTFIVSSIITVLMIVISVYINFFLIDLDNGIQTQRILEYVSNISLNILASTIVLMVTSLFEYRDKKNNIKNNILSEISNILDLFENVIFCNTKKYTYDTFLHENKFPKEMPNSKRRDLYSEYEEEVNSINKKNTMKTIKKYKEILDYNPDNLKNDIKELSLFSNMLFDRKKYLQYNLTEFIIEIQKKLIIYTNFINDCLNKKIVNTEEIIEQINEIQDTVFFNISSPKNTKKEWYVKLLLGYVKFFYKGETLKYYIAKIENRDKEFTNNPAFNRVKTIKEMVEQI